MIVGTRPYIHCATDNAFLFSSVNKQPPNTALNQGSVDDSFLTDGISAVRFMTHAVVVTASLEGNRGRDYWPVSVGSPKKITVRIVGHTPLEPRVRQSGSNEDRAPGVLTESRGESPRNSFRG